MHSGIEGYVEEEQIIISKDFLDEYLNKDEDRELIEERLDILNRGLYGDSSVLEGNNLLSYVELLTEPLIKKLTILVMTSDKVIIRRLDELEKAEQENPVMPNEWIYHKDLDFNKVLDYARDHYDICRLENQIEDTDPMV